MLGWCQGAETTEAGGLAQLPVTGVTSTTKYLIILSMPSNSIKAKPLKQVQAEF